MKEVQLLRQQIQVLQLRNDLYAKKAALGGPVQTSISASSAASSMSKKVLVASGLRMADSMKLLLTKCAEDKLEISGEDIGNRKKCLLYKLTYHVIYTSIDFKLYRGDPWKYS